MATIKVKRSAVAGRVPATTDLELGEIAINTYDGVAYIKKSVSGTDSVVQLGSANLSQNLQNRYQYTATAAQTTFAAVYLAPYVDVYLNGIRLIAGVDYTATNGTTVVLTSGASLNNTIDIVAYTSYTANANFADLISSHVTTALGYTPENPANKGVANGYASLNSSGQIPSAQLPSFVDDVIEYANLAALPATGESGKIYVTQDTNKTYRWSGSAYTEIASSPGSTDAVTEGSSNLYFSNARARNALSATQNLTYSSSTGVFTGPDLSGYLTSATAASVYAPLASPSFTGSVTSNGTTTLAGNVGIGTTPTTQRLKLGFDTTGRNGINITNFNISAGPAYIAFQGYDWVQSAIWHDRASGGALQFAVNPNTTDLSVNGCVVAATFLNNGNFGIGTTSPLGKLHISTTDMLSARKAYSGLGNTGAGDGIFEAYRLDGPLNYLRVLDIVSLGDSVNSRGSETRFFTTNTSGVTAERVKIDSSGNFGIGTNSPQSLLHLRAGGTTAVNGGIGLTISHNSNAIANATDALFAGVTIQRDKSSALADGDSLGGINWGKLIAGELRNSVAAIGAIQAGTGESAHLTFYTSPTARAPVERLRISEVGAFGLSGANYGTTGQVLTSQGSGSAPIWSSAGGGGSPAGSNKQLQFNNSGAFGGANLYYGNYQVGSTGYYIDQLSIGTGTETVSHPAFYVYKGVDNTSKCSTSENVIGLYSNNGNTPYSVGQLNHHVSGYVTNASGNYVTVGVAATAISSGWVPTQWPSGAAQTFPCIGVYSESNGAVGNQGGTAFYGISRPYYSNATGYYARIHNAATSGVGYGYRVDIGTHPFGSGAYGFASRIISGQGGSYSNCTGWYHYDETTSGDTSAALFQRGGSTVGSIKLSTSNTTYNTSSDPRLKNITGPITADEAKNFVMALQPKKGTWKVDGSDFKGFLSTEYEAIDPKAVSGVADATEILGKIFDADGKMLAENVPQPPANLLPPGGRWEQTQVKEIYQTLEYGSAAWCANMTAFVQSMQTTLTAQNQIVQELKSEFDAYKASHP